MKSSAAAAIALGCAFTLAGCGEKPSTQGNAGTNPGTSSGSVLTAPADYVGALGKGQQNATKTVDTASINKAIQLFNVDQGRNPKDLDELVQRNYLPQMPVPPNGMKLSYDSSAGEVKVVNQ